MEKQMPPRIIISEAVGCSTQVLCEVISGINDPTNHKRHQLLIPDSPEGLQHALLAYELFLTDTPLSGINDYNKQLLADYNNQWSYLFDALREANKDAADSINRLRDLQKKVHAKLIEVLKTGNESGKIEFEKFSEELRNVSVEWGESLEETQKRSRKGCKHVNTFISAEQAAEWAGVGVATIRRYWSDPKFGLPRPPLNDKTNPKGAMKKWGELYRSRKEQKKEANNMNHPVLESSLSENQKRRAGMV